MVFTQSITLFAQEFFYYCSKSTQPGASWQVYKKDLSTGAILAITNNTVYNYWKVVVSPNNQQLLMLRSPVSSSPDQENYENCEMIKSNADGSNQQVIIADNQNNWFAFGNPHWHPNGNRILMIAQPANSTNPFFLFTVDTEGNNPQQLSTQWAIDPNWSPDGNKIVFVGTTGTTDLTAFEIFTANYNYTLNTISGILQLTNDSTRDHDPCYSPNGTEIAFMAGPADIIGADIVKIDSSGNNRTPLIADNGTHGGQLNWAADNKIYYHSIYIFVSNFMAKAYNTITNTDDTLLFSSNFDYIHPYYTNSNSTSINNFNEDTAQFYVYPNPTTDLILIKADNPYQHYSIELNTLLGQQVLKMNNASAVDVAKLENGIYMMILKQGHTTFTSKIIKN